MRAIAAYHKMTKDDVTEAISLLNKAIAVEPDFANAHALIGLCTDVTAGYVVAGPERLREPMQRVTGRLKELIGLTAPEGETMEKLLG